MDRVNSPRFSRWLDDLLTKSPRLARFASGSGLTIENIIKVPLFRCQRCGECVQMPVAIGALRDAGLSCKVMVGGAVVTKRFADSIGATDTRRTRQAPSAPSRTSSERDEARPARTRLRLTPARWSYRSPLTNPPST